MMSDVQHSLLALVRNRIGMDVKGSSMTFRENCVESQQSRIIKIFLGVVFLGRTENIPLNESTLRPSLSKVSES
jgi:hypothetical protein